MKKPNAQYEVHLLLTVYKQSNPDKLALFYPVTTKSGDKYNYYLKPNADNLSVDLVKCCVNGLSPEQEEDISSKYLYFTSDPAQVGKHGVTQVDGAEGDDESAFALSDPPPHRN